MTYKELLLEGEKKLKQNQMEDAITDAWLLLEYVTGMDKQTYFLSMNETVETDKTEDYYSHIKRRCEHVPLQYITGEQNFMGLEFEVNPHVLIPRWDTEILVEKTMKLLQGEERILDMCTGSGCIMISLLKQYPKCRGIGVDISEKALQVAKRNAKRHLVSADWICSDLFCAVTGSFDVIVSNPPYIPTDIVKTLMPEVAEHEPVGALDGKEDGLFFYKKLIPESKHFLKKGGWILMEIGCEQGEAVSKLMRDNGFSDVTVEQDYSGKDRVVSGHL